jgi:hypothetical protein
MLKKSWKSGVAVFMTLGLTTTGTVVPLMLLERPAVAGLFSQSDGNTVQVPSGTTIRVAEQDGKKIIITPDETMNVTLVTTEAVRSSMGTVLIQGRYNYGPISARRGRDSICSSADYAQ